MRTPYPFKVLSERQIQLIKDCIKELSLSRPNGMSYFECNGNKYSGTLVAPLVRAGCLKVTKTNINKYPVCIVPDQDNKLVKNIHLLDSYVMLKGDKTRKIPVLAMGYSGAFDKVYLKIPKFSTGKWIELSQVEKTEHSK